MSLFLYASTIGLTAIIAFGVGFTEGRRTGWLDGYGTGRTTRWFSETSDRAS